MEPLYVFLEVRISLHIHLLHIVNKLSKLKPNSIKKFETYMLLQALLVQERSSLYFAIIGRTALCILDNLEWSLATDWNFSCHEGSRVLLELCALGLNLKLFIVVEGSCILAIHS